METILDSVDISREIQHVDTTKVLDQCRTLILNADYQVLSVLPLSSITWKSAITDLWLDKLETVHIYEDVVVRSPHMEIELPSVLRMKKYQSPKRALAFTKSNVYLRDKYTCQYCGNDFKGVDLTYDHVVPLSKGGKTNWLNITTSCRKCNGSKGNKTFDKWVSPLGLRKPKSKPYVPDYFDLASKVRNNPIIIPGGSNWLPYLAWSAEVFERDVRTGKTVSLTGSSDIGNEYLSV